MVNTASYLFDKNAKKLEEMDKNKFAIVLLKYVDTQELVKNYPKEAQARKDFKKIFETAPYEETIKKLHFDKVKPGIYTYGYVSRTVGIIVTVDITKEQLEKALGIKSETKGKYIIKINSVNGRTYYYAFPDKGYSNLSENLSDAYPFKDELSANQMGNKLQLDINSTWEVIPLDCVNTIVKLEVGCEVKNKYLNKTKWGIVRYDAHPEIDGTTCIDAIYFKDQDAKNKWVMASEEKNTLKVAPMNKVFAIETTRVRMAGPSTKNIWVGTIDQLRQAFSYTLECGQSYEYEKGNKKINVHPTNIKSLVSNLDKASANRCRDYQDTYYEQIDLTDELYEKWVRQQADNPSSYSERINN